MQDVFLWYKNFCRRLIELLSNCCVLHNGWRWYQVGCIGCIANTGIKIAVPKNFLLRFWPGTG